MYLPKGKQTERKGQKMNEKTRMQIEEMKKQTIGVEVEMYGITREKAARTIAAYFHTEDTVRFIGGGYSAWACKDNQGREWKITRDVSIQASCDEEKAELGTPILTYDDIPDLQEILRQLRHKGAKSDPNHMCGVHIHIGLGEHTPKSLRNLANIMASHENLLISAMRLDRTRINRYCRTVDPDFLKRLNRRKPKTMAQLADVWYANNSGESRNAHYNGSRFKSLCHKRGTGTGMCRPTLPLCFQRVCCICGVAWPERKSEWKGLGSRKRVWGEDIKHPSCHYRNIRGKEGV